MPSTNLPTHVTMVTSPEKRRQSTAWSGCYVVGGRPRRRSDARVNVAGKRCLLLGCSRAKRQGSGLLPAIERYDGPSFRVLRRFLREKPDAAEQLDVFILSAVHGLIHAQHPIPDYNQMMTPQRAIELHDSLFNCIVILFNNNVYSSLCLSMSRVYLIALEGWSTLVPSETSVTLVNGPHGVKLARLQRWLWCDVPGTRSSGAVGVTPHHRVCIRGVEVNLMPEQVFDAARRALADHPSASGRYDSWYLLVDGQRVAPKWLVSQLTGLPVSGFHSQEARRVLQQLGVEVRLEEAWEIQ